MSSIAFDTHRFVKRLTAAGMPEKQAEVLAEEQASLVDEKLATKRDIQDVRRDLEVVKTDLEAKIEAVETRMMGELRLVKWMLALVIAATVIPLIRDLF